MVNRDQIVEMIALGYCHEAEQALEEHVVHCLNPAESSSALALRARLESNTGRQEEAIATALSVLEQSHSPSAAAVECIAVLAQNGQADLAQKYMQSRKDLTAHETELLSGTVANARGEYHKAIGYLQAASKGAWLTLGEIATAGLAEAELGLGAFERTIQLLTRALDDHPLDVSLLALLVRSHCLQGNPEEAIHVASNAIAAGDVPPVLSKELAYAYSRIADWIETYRHAVNVLFSDLWDERALFDYAEAATKLRAFDEAEVAYSALLESSRYGKLSSFRLATIYFKQLRLRDWWRLALYASAKPWNAAVGNP